MTQHKDIQNPDGYNDNDYTKWEVALFDENTPKEQLEEIVMTLAHLPSKRAQDLLGKFKKSDRADEVEWLEPAMEEGKFHYISANNETEERDMIALKLYFKKEEEIVDLMGKCQTYEIRIQQYNIELNALTELQKEKISKAEKEDIKYSIIALNDITKMEQGNLEEANADIKMTEKINKKIKESITTERYKNLESWDVKDFHFDGEEL